VIVRVSLAPRARGVTREQLQAHWRQHHADAAARLPGLQGYVQNHSVLRDGKPLLPGLRFDVCAELTFGSPEEMDTAFTSNQYSGPALASQRQMIVPERLALAFMRRRVLHRGAPAASAVKLMTFLRARPELQRGELETALTGTYRDAVATSSPIGHELLLLDPPAHHGRATAAFEAVDILWFDTPEQALEHATGDGALAADWELSGVVFGSERLLVRPHRIA
jgi:hypothetical protein